ncbi:MmgE/PrpD family protein [Chloroflexota bacterium]
MSVTEELVSHVLETRFEAIPGEVLERARDIVIDVLGCSVGGANAPGCPAMVDLIRQRNGKEESTILAYGVRVPAYNAAFANAVMARVMDYGAVEIFINGEATRAHIGEILAPTAIALAEQKAIGGKELLTALVLGEDLVIRTVIAASPQFSQSDSAGILSKLVGGASIVSVFGAGAIAARLSVFDKRQLLSTFGIALDEVSGARKRIYDGVRYFELGEELAVRLGISASFGLAAQFGILAAQLASKGSTGVEDPLTGERGYFTFYCRDYHPEILTRELGRTFHTEVTFKPYPCCRGNHSGIDCALEIVRKHEVDASNIDEVTVIVSPGTRDFLVSIPWEIEGPPHYTANLNAHQSLQYNVANTLLRKSSRLEHFTDDFIRDPQIAEIIKKVKITSEGWPTVPGETFSQATTVIVRMKDGKEFSESVKSGRGHEIYNPLTKEEKREKFIDNAKFSRKITVENARKALNMLERLEEVDDIKKIVRLLTI